MRLSVLLYLCFDRIILETCNTEGGERSVIIRSEEIYNKAQNIRRPLSAMKNDHSCRHFLLLLTGQSLFCASAGRSILSVSQPLQP